MSDREQVRASIEVVDNGSAKFAAAANAADKMGKTVEESGKRGARGLDEMKKQADELEKRYTKLGATAGTVVGVLSKLGQAQDRERQTLAGLQQAYGHLANDVEAYGDRLQDVSRFSDDASDRAALLASTLTREYGLTAEQALILVQRSADLAQVYGFTLPDAVNRTASAIRGEAEAAEALGVAMADSVLQAEAARRGMEGWTTTMTEAEKAQVRFDVLMEQTAFAQGRARLAAEGTTGEVIHLKNELQDLTLKAAGFLGPATETAAVLGDVALILPVAGAGFGKLVGQLKASEAGFLGMAGAAGKGLAALGAIGALVAGGYLTYDLIANFGEAGEHAGESFILNLNETIYEGLGGISFGLLDPLIDPTLDRIKREQIVNAYEQAIEDAGLEVQPAITMDPQILLSGEEDVVQANQRIRELNITIHELEARAISAGRSVGEQLLFELESLGYTVNAVTGEIELVTDATDHMAQGAARGVGPINQVNEGLRQQKRALDDLKGAGRDVPGREPLGQAPEGYLEAVEAAERASIAFANTLRSQLGQSVAGLDGSVAGLTRTLGIYGDDILDVLAYTQSLGLATGDAAISLRDTWVSVADAVSDIGAAYDDVLAIFGVVDQLGQRSGRAVSIADALIGDPDTWATIDDLLQNNIISRRQYDQAVEAGYRIQSRDLAIQEDLNAIRAQQLPTLALQEERYAIQIDRVAHLSREEQAYALALQDSATAQQVTTAYSTAYAASLGQIPEEVATDIIANAAAADPVLFDVLERLGLIKEGANGEITVTLPDESLVALNRFEDAFGAENVTVDKYGLIHVEQAEGTEAIYDPFFNLISAPDVVEKTVRISVEAQGVAEQISGFTSGLFGGGGEASREWIQLPPVQQPVTIAVDVDTTQATEGVTAWVERTDGTSGGFLEVSANTDPAMTQVADSVAVIDATSATVNVDGNLSPLYADIAAVDGRVVGTAYIAIGTVGASIGTAGNSGINVGGSNPRLHGGLVTPSIPRAQDGMVVRMNEAGGELALLPNGSMVIPHPASMGMLDQWSRWGGGGGREMTVTHNVNLTLNGRDVARFSLDDVDATELAFTVAKELAPALVDVVRQVQQGYGF